MHRLCLPLLVLFFASSALAQQSQSQLTRRPNVVFILADDLGYGDLGCYGHPYAKTPNIDNLAKSGTKFNRFYATGVTCQPSRVGFMTSRHPHSFKRRVGDFGFDGRATITELLQENGYATGHFGKWHIGPGDGGKKVSENIRILGRSAAKPVMPARDLLWRTRFDDPTRGANEGGALLEKFAASLNAVPANR